jgi:hypothetical protein
MYNLNTKIIGNENWQDTKVLQKENISPHLKGMSIITHSFRSTIDSIVYEGEFYDAYFQGFNIAQLLTQLKLKKQTRQAISKSLQNIDFYSGNGFYYSPDKSNLNVNAAFQVIEFDGRGFIHEGVFHGDSLKLVSNQIP